MPPNCLPHQARLRVLDEEAARATAEEAAAEAAARASEAAAREAAASAEAAAARAAASEAKGEAALMASELEARSSELEARSSELEARSAELTISMELRREVERRAAEELEACRLAAHAAARTRQAEVRSLMAIDCLSHCMHAAGVTILCVPSPIPNPKPSPMHACNERGN